MRRWEAEMFGFTGVNPALTFESLAEAPEM
jgi:hypothetical protein